MAMQTIDPWSGYLPIDLDKGEMNSNVKRIEVDNYQIAVYFEQVRIT